MHSLGPPVEECYNCSRKLVSYLATGVKLFTSIGVKTVEKVTLRCKECNLIYGPIQFGNKHTEGFQFYTEEQLIVEVTDTVYFFWSGSVALRK